MLNFEEEILETFIINQFRNLTSHLPSKTLKIRIHKTILSFGFECVCVCNAVCYFDENTSFTSLLRSVQKTMWT